jgi:uncharacterized protein YsxB (DUF464 family)
MTDITIKRRSGRVVAIQCDGHTGYGEEGEDIVCAALSSIVQTAILGLMGVVGVDVGLKRDDQKGHLSAKLPDKMTAQQKVQAAAILDTLLLGVQDLYEGYSDFINLEVLEDVY